MREKEGSSVHTFFHCSCSEWKQWVDAYIWPLNLKLRIAVFCGCRSIGDSVWLWICKIKTHGHLYALCTNLHSPSRRWILIFTMLTVAAADEAAPSNIIPHDYIRMLMAVNNCKCLKVCVCCKWLLNSHKVLLANGYLNILLPGCV